MTAPTCERAERWKDKEKQTGVRDEHIAFNCKLQKELCKFRDINDCDEYKHNEIGQKMTKALVLTYVLSFKVLQRCYNIVW